MSAAPSLRRIREARGLTRRVLAELSDISIHTISEIERGKNASIRPRTLSALASALEVREDALELNTTSPAGLTHSGAKKHGIHKILHRLFADDPHGLAAAMVLFVALCDAESHVTGLAAEARFWLKFGAGRNWLELLNVDVMFDRVLDDLTPLPGEGDGPEALRLMRLMDLEHIA